MFPGNAIGELIGPLQTYDEGEISDDQAPGKLGLALCTTLYSLFILVHCGYRSLSVFRKITKIGDCSTGIKF